MKKYAVILFLLSTGVFYTPVSATIYNVNNGHDTGIGSFRQAIEDANNMTGKDTIQFAAFLLITLNGALPDIVDEVDIFGNNSNVDAASISGILRTFSTIYIQQLDFRNANKSSFGGALLLFTSIGEIVKLKDCNFYNNRSSSVGGAIYSGSSSGDLSIEDCIFEDNVGSIGGAIAHHGNKLYMKDVRFDNNDAAFGKAIQLIKNELIIDGQFYSSSDNDIAIESGLGGNPEVIFMPTFTMLPGSTLEILKI